MASTSIDNKIIDILVKGSFHQGDLSIFSADSVGRQCIVNCVAAVSFAKLVPLYKWSSNNIDSILKCGDSIYKTVKTNHDFLHVSDVGSKISAFHQIFNISTNAEYYGSIEKKSVDTFHTTLEKSTCTMIRKTSRNNKWIFGILCVGDIAGASASLPCLSSGYCYILDPHSCNSEGMSSQNGTAVLMRFKCHKHVVDFIKKKFSRPSSDIFNLTEIAVDIYTEEVVTYLSDQKYQEMKNEKSFSSVGKTSDVQQNKIQSAKCNVNKQRKRKKINPREYWTNSKISKKSVSGKVNIQMKSDNSHASIKKKQDNERQSFMYRKYQNRKNNADENFMENSETKSKAIDPCCHQLKRKLSDTSSNVNKESKRKKINPREY